MKTKTITVFAQICNQLLREPLIHISQEMMPVTDGRKTNAQKYNAWDLLTALIFCHLGRCTSLRAIEDGLFTAQQNLHHAKQARYLKRSTLSYINSHSNYEIFEKYYYVLLNHFKKELHLRFPKSISKPVFSLDSTTISVCLSLFPWARFRTTKGGFKLHTALSHENLLPQVVDMTDGKIADVKQAKDVIKRLPAESFVVMDRGYNDYELFAWLTDRGTNFVTRLKDNAVTTDFCEHCEAKMPGRWGIYHFRFKGKAEERCKDKKFRLIQWNDTENNRWFDFVTNNFDLGAPEIAQLYRDRWKVELFFKKLKQNLCVQSFVGRSENAVMNQVWVAMITTLLVEVMRRRAKYDWSFSRLFDYLSMNLLTHNDLEEMINRPTLPNDDDNGASNREDIPVQMTFLNKRGDMVL